MLFALVSLQLNSFASDITINDTKTYNNRDKVKVEDRCIEFKSRVAKITFSTDLDIEVKCETSTLPPIKKHFFIDEEQYRAKFEIKATIPNSCNNKAVIVRKINIGSLFYDTKTYIPKIDSSLNTLLDFLNIDYQYAYVGTPSLASNSFELLVFIPSCN